MKNVFTNSELPHIYASNTQDAGRTSDNNFYFERGIIYSYGRHFPIAARVNELHDTYLMTTRRYSNTTARHISLVRQALRHARLIYCNNPADNISVNLQSLKSNIENAYIRADRVKYPEGRGKGQIAKISNEIQGYINEAVKLIELQNELSAINADYEIMVIPEWCSLSDNLLAAAKAFADMKKVEAERLAKERAEKERKELRKVRDYLKDWLTDNTMRIIAGFNKLPVVCRIVGEDIQTSHGAIVPIQAIKDAGLWNKIQGSYTDKTVEEYDLHISHYHGVKLDKGNMVIGCHSFAYKELARIAGIA